MIDTRKTPIEDNIKTSLTTFLKKVIKQPLLHAKWLNTLSFLEYIGARKILKSQHANSINWFLLQHIREETGHALFFKSLVQKISKKYCPTFETPYLLKGKQAENYFQSIDHPQRGLLSPQRGLLSPQSGSQGEPSNNMKNAYLNYLYTTWMIEERALKVYQLYNALLKENNFPFNLNMVLREEDHHLQIITQQIKKQDSNFKQHTQQLFQYESKQFYQLTQEWLEQAL